MRFLFALLLCCWPQAGFAEAGTQCSQGRFGHAFCVRPAFFNFDLCHMLQGEAARHGLDPGFFTRLIWQESRFDPNAISPADAFGIAQFIASTAQLRGLEDPFNPGEALEASAEYLAFLIREFGNEGLAAVAYNGGEGRAARFIAGRSGLPRETVNYVQIITGVSARRWRDAPPKEHSFELEKGRAFLPACLALASGRRVTRLASPEPLVKTWGVQIAFGETRAQARRAMQARSVRCRSLVSREKIQYLPLRNRVRGRRDYIAARIGRNTKRSAINLCLKLSRAGCQCRVMRN